jgi:hypothetical protein
MTSVRHTTASKSRKSWAKQHRLTLPHIKSGDGHSRRESDRREDAALALHPLRPQGQLLFSLQDGPLHAVPNAKKMQVEPSFRCGCHSGVCSLKRSMDHSWSISTSPRDKRTSISGCRTSALGSFSEVSRNHRCDCSNLTSRLIADIA